MAKNSLPADIKNDVMNKVNEQGEAADPIYNSIQTQSKIEKKELEDLKTRLEDDLNYLKDKLAEDNISSKNTLTVLGIPWPPYFGSHDNDVHPSSIYF